jgi:hypothetical protein
VRGFLLEVLAVPVIHNFSSSTSKRALLCLLAFCAMRLLDGLGNNSMLLRLSTLLARTRCIRLAWLGQVKFRASMSDAEWADALRTVDRAQLYSEKPSDKPLTEKGEKQRNTRLANKAELRRQANERLDTLWPDGYCSYIFTICEPPAGVRHEQWSVGANCLCSVRVFRLVCLTVLQVASMCGKFWRALKTKSKNEEQSNSVSVSCAIAQRHRRAQR